MDTHSQEARQQLKDELCATNDQFIAKIPKVELHVHIEGTLTPDLRWKFAQRNGIQVPFGRKGNTAGTLEQLKSMYTGVISSAQLPDFAGQPQEIIPATFFQAYFSGFEVLRTRQDFYDLAFAYFERAAEAQVRYCEVFFDPQGHTSRGVSWGDMMEGFRQAQQEAAANLKIHSQWIMCFWRDQSPESAMEHYEAALAYRDMIVGFGLDANELDRPPILFQHIFTRARQDGFNITAHCDVGVKDTHIHIEQCASVLGGLGADRIDHGLNVADKRDLIELVLQKRAPLTMCPWAYIRREGYESVAKRLRILIDAGVCLSIACDGPSYTDDCWIIHNMLLARRMCDLTNEEFCKIAKDSVHMSWASEEIKKSILDEIAVFSASAVK